jgi:hypothetical protein
VPPQPLRVTGKANHVTLQNLTIRGFDSRRERGVVNHDSGAGWVIENSTMVDNRGAAMMAGPGQVCAGTASRKTVNTD